ncbi:MAG: hypothetical protein ABWZ53_03470 [Actinomycetota bacterium]
MSQSRSGAAVGFTMFAAFMMILVGAFHIVASIAGIIEDQFYVTTENYFLEFDATTWGWIHLVGGVIVLLAGFGLFSGAVWARTVGVILATISAIASFAFIPHYPVWSIAVIAIDIFIIWALTVHGRDLVG